MSARDGLREKAEQLSGLNDRIRLERDDLTLFCQTLSHDFTGPVIQARCMAMMVAEELQEKSSDFGEEVEMLELVTGNLTSLKALIDGLLEFLVAGVDERWVTAVDLNAVVSAAIDLSGGPGSSSVRVTAEDLPPVRGSAAQLQLLFTNLIGNAIKYNDRQPEIAITCDGETREGYHVITVRDNGIGMSEEHLEKIFEPFTPVARAEQVRRQRSRVEHRPQAGHEARGSCVRREHTGGRELVPRRAPDRPDGVTR